ncbi:MAG TPA: winged helix-turn-helix domain-containing protein [Gammaproteobacteria bacterium]|nr:winged helix-turn-helix domain-containing protein [Gammaproteobacteria bacterium]
MLYRLEGCELDGGRFELRRNGVTVPVERQVLELLLYLVANRDRAVTRTELFDNLWRGRVVTESALNSRVKAARSAIGDDGKSQSRIRTLHRTGYRFVGQVEELCDTAARVAGNGAVDVPAVAANVQPAAAVPAWAPVQPAAAQPAAAGQLAAAAHVPPEEPRPAGRDAPSSNAPAPARFTRRLLELAGAALALLLAAAALSLVPRMMPDTAPSQSAAASPAAAPAAAVGAKSIAVLPFTNLSGDPEQDYFADGVSVELLNVLSHLPDLQVTGRASSAYFKGRNDSLLAIGKTLGVSRLVTGSVRKSGEHVRIAVELVDAGSGVQLWADSYDRKLDDLFDVQDEIAARVATALQVKLGLGVSGELGMTRNVAAYDEFLRGTALYSEYRPESFPLAAEHMYRALALDPGFSRAWAYLYCIHMDGRGTVPEHAEEWARRAVESLDHARELTPDATFVRILDARNELHFGDRLKARAVLDSLPAGFWTADRNLTRDAFRGAFLLNTGYVKAAVEALERGRAADPLSSVMAMYLSLAYAAAGDTAAALAETDRGLETGDLAPLLRGNAMLLALGTHDEKVIRARVAAAPGSSPEQHAVNDALVQRLHDPAAARAELHKLAATPSDDYLRNVVLAYWAAYYGEPEIALETLSGILKGAGDDGLLWRPVLSEARKLPAFKELVRRDGLVDYWRMYGWPDFCRPTAGEDFECV